MQNRLGNLLDQVLRDNQIRPSCLVLISKGKAARHWKQRQQERFYRFVWLILSKMPIEQQGFCLLCRKLKYRACSIQDLVFCSKKFISEWASQICRSRRDHGMTHKMTGVLNEEELEAVTWITGKGKGGVVKSYDKETGQQIVYEINLPR
ncbi:hypothetical protein ACFX4I_25660 [Peribacillus sp. YIM B13472]|uniref:hypothetical protein n=1 Tax=Peribacillus TaxID=2675229 RepID=UPI0028535E37|nr:hypothetical protein [Peribacillus simplex]MDR4929586.1 hypothetical protein [Peribacillus simplex]